MFNNCLPNLVFSPTLRPSSCTCIYQDARREKHPYSSSITYHQWEGFHFWFGFLRIADRYLEVYI